MINVISKTIILVIAFTTFSNGQSIDERDVEIEKLDNISLEEGLKYRLQYADSNYLIFVEFFTQEVFLYNLKKQEVVYSKTIPKGKGPFEFTTISGAVIIDDKLYLSSRKEPKLIQIDFKKDGMKELRLEKLIVRDLSIYKSDIIIKNSVIANLFVRFNLKENMHSFINFKNFDSLNEFSNFFFKEGDFSVHGDKLFFTTTYLPYIYVFNLKTEELIDKIAFDVPDVEQPRQVDMGNGDVATLPPESNFKTKEIAGVPGYSNKAVIVTEGKGENKKYSYYGLYEYDLKEKRFTNRYPFNFEIRSVVSNDEYIFFSSYDDLNIYKMRIKN